jgi:hypothetical protein
MQARFYGTCPILDTLQTDYTTSLGSRQCCSQAIRPTGWWMIPGFWRLLAASMVIKWIGIKHLLTKLHPSL